jgi:hypothetical protein
MLLKPAPTSTRQFLYQPAGNLLTAEMSSLNGFGRVWDDACDEGLTLVSHRTGREVVYAVSGMERDRDGDIAAWTLRPASPRDAALPTVKIYND